MHISNYYRYILGFGILLVLLVSTPFIAEEPSDVPTAVSTFSIVARDPATGELGIAVASRFFAVGSVVPWARADVGAVATQAFANTSFGERGLELLARGATPEEALTILLRTDADPDRRQVGIVAADGSSITYTGKGCTPWAGGKQGPNYAIQGNILTGEEVVENVEKAFLSTKGTLAERLYEALVAGDRAGGDSRGKQSAALLVVKDRAGYGGFTDRAIDIRVDDHPEPFRELGRLLVLARVNYGWNEAWTLFTEQKAPEALPIMERTAKLAPDNGEVLYDLAVIRLAAGKKGEALEALKEAVRVNPKLRQQAREDSDLEGLRSHPDFESVTK
ncbi:MAG TPA: DUF1028 domain-containing protein [Thermoanaerobaculia bacterium]|nr:DUF1028 domain-containing protein [Thermoanaerobaculia bacterium]HUM30400.1 DUF1028 domain-containing protein [Thermoanaerobaculia bacterium]HXK68589.1 DUF1028 domain-containing protein [Thermoanaerobaculia bacterium]